ncbi:hypothetical protein Kpol_1002p33 [Vanderwaltozyma polyspora DSM 70294]|uniref:Selenoprotein O n=1 Tax=Vanderwaltozyma polyspora (strain ATCC 22028 / DSM 70294 / BCRC 21397 / CBS 2163 / NBRC 10782 / NRRL Y-8283 / UCD 57-17) TaxID=436907 RepID=A7TE64_VANPO|nr:uncharacterized protein Kpol_1002p33 [Vanderwaltozyma polyspora DSM 70294]EDO19386.1 hypothetical protein Kpol_1002p33 [Vanderwaltozyma polyspora DSM 70294]
MSESRSILQVLKEGGNSRLIKKLTPDHLIPSISSAISAYEGNQDVSNLDKDSNFHTPRLIAKGSHFAYTAPEKRPFYKPLIVSDNAVQDMGLKVDDEFYKIFDGEQVYYTDKVFPYSLAYAGFQFGNFAGQLGDGRVVNLFDLRDRNNKWQTFQLKGSGLTPFSRFADGKAVLRSSIREFIISEALHGIGIPSTRAIQLTSLPKTRARRAEFEPCAVVCRFSPCWIRLGNFDLFRWRPDLKGLVSLTDFCIDSIFDNGSNFPKELDINMFDKNYFPDSRSGEVKIPFNKDEELHKTKLEGCTKYDLFFRHVVNLNAECVAYWQSYGFVNGVLNTDNTSIMGLSMDYGPFSFLDKFQPDFTPNHDDSTNRYSFKNQPSIIWWNLVQFAQSLSPLIGASEKHLEFVMNMNYNDMDRELEMELVNRANKLIELAYNEYRFRFTTKYAGIMSKRLGIDLSIPKSFYEMKDIERASEVTKEFCDTILEPLLNILQSTQIDYNNFFVNLQNYEGEYFIDKPNDNFEGLDENYVQLFFDENQFDVLKNLSNDNKTTRDSIWEEKLPQVFEQLKEWTISYTKIIPKYKEKLRISSQVNPLFTPRNWIFDEVIDDFMMNQRNLLNQEKVILDTSLLKKLYLMSSNPYDSSKWDSSLKNEKENEWSNLRHVPPEEKEKFMRQGTCSS